MTTTTIAHATESEIAHADQTMTIAVSLSTPEELVAAVLADSAANIILSANIDFTSYTTSTTAIISGTFTGTLDGNGYAMVNS